MFKIMTFFFVAITLNGEEITRVGPFLDGGTCVEYRHNISHDIREGFENGIYRFGQGGDTWGVGSGAIFRFSDYEFPCVSVTVNTETNEVLDEFYTW